MTKRQRQARIREVQAELLAKIQERFPLVEWLDTEERPGGTIAIRVYAPYEDKLAVLEATGTRIVELAADEDLHVMILPLSYKPADKAA